MNNTEYISTVKCYNGDTIVWEKTDVPSFIFFNVASDLIKANLTVETEAGAESFKSN